jgi:hypothetical protein
LNRVSFTSVVRALSLLTMFFVVLSGMVFASTPIPVPPTGGYVRNEHNSRVLIFVHGLFSGPDAWQCDSDHYWPSMIAADKDPAFSKTDIYVVGYPTPKKGGKMSIADLNTLIFNRLQADAVFEHHEVVFVAHSLGGILTQQLLLTYKKEELYKKVSFIYFYGTPQEGSNFANLGKYFSSDPLIKELTTGDSNLILQDMDEKWRHAGFTSIKRFCAYETEHEHGMRVVDRYSATRNCDSDIAIPADHRGIVKPCDTRSDSYTALKQKMETIHLDDLNSSSRQNISVVPDVSLDSQEAFQQQFAITNNGPLDVTDVHFACAVSSLVLNGGKPSPLMLEGMLDHKIIGPFYFMIPVMKSISLALSERTTADCDFIARDGSNLDSANIEIIVAYKTTESREELYSSHRFSLRRDINGQVRWTNGSSDVSVLRSMDTRGLRRVVAVHAFAGGNRQLAPHPAPEELLKVLESWAAPLNAAGSTVVLGTMISGNYW